MNLASISLLLGAVIARFSIQDKACGSDGNKNILLDLDFYNTVPIIAGPNPTWTYFNLIPGNNATQTDDGVLTFSPKGALLRSVPFTKWSPPTILRELNDIKFMLTTTKLFQVPAHGKMTIEWYGTVETSRTGESPFPKNVLQGCDDYRLGSGVFSFQSTINGSAFLFLLTNNRVYAFYRRSPYHRGDVYGNYFGYSYAIPIASRKSCDWHKMKIVLDSDCKLVHWYLNGKRKFTVKPGFKPDGDYTPVIDFGGDEVDGWPPALAPAFGTVTDLSAYPSPLNVIGCDEPQRWPEYRIGLVRLTDEAGDAFFPTYNPILGPPTPVSYWDDVGTSQEDHIWGQGVTLGIKRLRIYTDKL